MREKLIYRLHFRPNSIFLYIGTLPPVFHTYDLEGVRSAIKIKERNDHFVLIFVSSDTVLTYSCSYYRLYYVACFIGYISSDSFQIAHLSPHGVDCSGRRIEGIPGGSFCFLFFSDDFYFARLPEDEHIMALPVMLKSLRMSGVGNVTSG